MKTDQDRFNRTLFVVDSNYAAQTGGRDSTVISTKYYNYARAGQSIFSALASLIKTNDDVVGDAVQDVIVGQFYPGYNWFLKGENNITNGWVKLEIH